MKSLLLCTREDGFVPRNLKWPASRVLFGTKKKKEKKEKVFGGMQVRLRRERWNEGKDKERDRKGRRFRAT